MIRVRYIYGEPPKEVAWVGLMFIFAFLSTLVPVLYYQVIGVVIASFLLTVASPIAGVSLLSAMAIIAGSEYLELHHHIDNIICIFLFFITCAINPIIKRKNLISWVTGFTLAGGLGYATLEFLMPHLTSKLGWILLFTLPLFTLLNDFWQRKMINSKSTFVKKLLLNGLLKVFQFIFACLLMTGLFDIILNQVFR